MDPSHAFDFPLGDLAPAELGALDAALQREGIEHAWSGSTLSVDIAFEARVNTLVDQARGGALPPAAPLSPSGPPLQGTIVGDPTLPGGPVPGPNGTAPVPAAYPGPSAYPAPTAYPAPAYGQPAYGAPQYGGYAAYGSYGSFGPKNNGMAIASLILGLASLVFCGPLLSIPAIITGHISRRQIRDSNGNETGEGMAMAGLVVGYIVTGLYAALIIFYIVIIAWAASQPSTLR